jgi:rhomboid family GlyGly-CTERM serine protease
MARGFRLSAWPALAMALAAAALLALALPRSAIDWQPGLVASQPWRCWGAAFVHWSALHLAANLIGCLLVGALGVVGECGLRSTWAWLLAWPLTQIGLLLQPSLLHYGGLSGVLHAGVAVAATDLLLREQGRRRWIAALLLAGLATKVVLEAPWLAPLRHVEGWDIAIAPMAHASGVVAGVFCLLAVVGLQRRRPAALEQSRSTR